MNKKTVGVFFGSRSAEHDVSIVTALTIIKPLERSGLYTPIPVYVAKDGRWFSGPELRDITLFSSGKIEDYMQRTKPVALEFGGLTLVKPGFKTERTKIDIAFPATHGTYGEDGSLMGVLRMANIPFVGADLAASAIAMDKVLCKQVAEHEGINVTKWVWCTKQEFETNQKTVLEKITALRYPLFVKPAHLGSSIGITKVSEQKDLVNALEVAAHYDDRILIEEGVQNLIEVTVPVMGNDELRVGAVERPLSLADGDVFDFDAKYMNQGKGGKATGKQGAQGYSELPAKLPGDLYQRAEDTAKAVYRAIGDSGYSRVDLLIDSKTNAVYFNEVNPLPGSLYLHNWQAAGMSPVQVVSELIRLAVDRHTTQQSLATTFSTNFLKQDFGGQL